MDNKPLVSVVITVFNQKDYIEECLRSVQAQKTDFDFEVLIGDDASTDGTQDLLRSIKPTFPDNFIFYLREKNMGERGLANSGDLLMRCRGKYLCILEGDDFWTYDRKLQEQADFLEAHPEFAAMFGKVCVVGADSKPSGIDYPECPKPEYTFKEFFYCSMPGQDASSMFRCDEFRRARVAFNDMKLYKNYPGDRRNAFFTLCNGRVACPDDMWSAYRFIQKGGSSYSANVGINEEYAQNEVDFARTCVKYAQSIDNAEALKCAKMMYYRVSLKWSVGSVKCRKLSEVLGEIMAEKHWPTYLFTPVRWSVVLVLRQLRGIKVTM